MSRRRVIRLAALAATAAFILGAAVSAQDLAKPSAGNQLFVGTCYQPVDRSPEQIKQDIAIMKTAGFTMVRMGDLSWDSFEPEEGHFTFDWFDDALAQMHAAVIDIGHDPIDTYKLVILPSAYLMDEATISAVRNYVAGGGTVIMTGYSDKVDSTGKWFETPLPGELTDVFGLRTNEFYRSDQPLRVSFNGEELTGTDSYYEVLEPSTARTLAEFENTPQHSPAITVNRYGKGQAIYLATAPQAALVGPLIRSLYAKLGIDRGPETPEGVVARTVEGRTMYVNTKDSPVSIPFAGSRTDALTGKHYSGAADLPGYGVALLQ